MYGDHTGRQQNHIWTEAEINEVRANLWKHSPQTTSDRVVQTIMFGLYHTFNFVTGYKVSCNWAGFQNIFLGFALLNFFFCFFLLPSISACQPVTEGDRMASYHARVGCWRAWLFGRRCSTLSFIAPAAWRSWLDQVVFLFLWHQDTFVFNRFFFLNCIDSFIF
jgi:hypothetical protein